MSQSPLRNYGSRILDGQTVFTLWYEERCDFDHEFHCLLGVFWNREMAEQRLEECLEACRDDREAFTRWMQQNGGGCGSISGARDKFGIAEHVIE